MSRWLICFTVAECWDRFGIRTGNHKALDNMRRLTSNLTITSAGESPQSSYVQTMITGMMMEGGQHTDILHPLSQADRAWTRSQDIFGIITHHISPKAGNLCKAG